MADSFDPENLDPPVDPEIEPEDPSTMYWAKRPADLLLPELAKKEKAFFDFLQRQGLGDAFLGAYCGYYGRDPDSLAWESHGIQFDGEDGELLRFRINQTRSYVRQSTSMALGQRPAFQAIATNSTYETLSQIETCDTAINYIYWAKFGEKKERRATEAGDVFGLSWTWVTFDPDGGEEIQIPIPLPPEAGGGDSPRFETKRAGEVIIKSKKPWDVICEPTIEEYDDHLWRTVRDQASRYELAARYPEHRERLLKMSGQEEFAIETFFGFDVDAVNSDLLVTKHFYHAKTRALPDGRYVLYCGDLCLYDGPLPFRTLPLADYCPSELMGTSFGYSESWDLIPLQQMLDQIVSDVASNLATFGRQSVVIERGLQWEPEMLANGLHVLTVPKGTQIMPQAVQLAAIPEAAKWALEYLESKFQSITGLNAVSRGDTSTMPSSGTLAALFHSIAQEVNSAKQLAVDAHRERVANLILNVIRDYMEHPMLVEIVGADERPYLQSITKDQFKSVQKVIIKTSNPMSRTTAGRLELARMLLDVPGAVTTPAQVIEVATTGQLKPLVKAPRAALLRIAYENEVLSTGPEVVQKPDPINPVNPDGTPRFIDTVPSLPVFPTDNPADHIHEHAAGLSNPGALQNDAIRRANLAHIWEHYQTWLNLPPPFLQLMGFPVPPPPAEFAAMLGKPAANDGGEGGNESSSGPASPAAPQERDSTGVKLPKPAQPPPGTRLQSVG